jgi:predicted acyl esterase
MVGISYPGISQLFVAQTQPPSLTAISPFSVIDDSYNGTLYPGGILNTGFAVDWTQQRVDEAQPAPDGQEWAANRIAAGDETCEANQSLRLQNPDLVEEIVENDFYEPAIADELAPRLFVDQIEVPTFIAGAWQDEQTGGRFPTMISEFTGTDHLYVSLVNGLHTESISPMIFARLVEFLDLYVAERTPSLAAASVVAPILAGGIFGTTEVGVELGVFDDRFAGMTHEDALAAFEAEPPVQVMFEQGAAEGVEPLAPLPRFVRDFDSWPIPADVEEWYLGSTGSLLDAPEVTSSTVDYLALPDGIPETFHADGGSDTWRTDVEWNWQDPAPGTAATFLSQPLVGDLPMIGSASADLWITSNLGDTDLEVTLSEVRPDGNEVYVQSGWLRASHRSLDESASTRERPVHTHAEADARPLDPETLELVRVEVFPFAHVFRAGSQIRVSIDAPGGNRARWEFETIANGEQVTIGIGGDTPSRIVLPTLRTLEVPAEYPACDSLRGQPCRPFAS